MVSLLKTTAMQADCCTGCSSASPNLEPIFFRKLAERCGPLTLEVDDEMIDPTGWLTCSVEGSGSN